MTIFLGKKIAKNSALQGNFGNMGTFGDMGTEIKFSSKNGKRVSARNDIIT
jgi:hypothetical protein